MRPLLLWLIIAPLSPLLAADADRPSIELLLYLAEWGTDEQGRAIDLLELADDADPASGDSGADASASRRNDEVSVDAR